MVAGADSIDDMDVLRHGGMGRVVRRGPGALDVGHVPARVHFGHVRQLDAVAARLLAGLAAATPLLPGADEMAYLDIDDTVRADLRLRQTGRRAAATPAVEGLNALLAALSTPPVAPVIVGDPAAEGIANSARGAARLRRRRAGHRPASRAGLAGTVMLRGRTRAFYGGDVDRRLPPGRGPVLDHRPDGPRPSPRRSRAIPDNAWTAIRYPNAIFDEDEQRWISDAEVAEIAFTAFTSRRKAEQVTARLIVRRVRAPQPDTLAGRAGRSCSPPGATTPCSPTSPLPMLAAEADHRDHAIIEQVIADLKNGPLAHLPSGKFAANAAWLVCAAIATT